MELGVEILLKRQIIHLDKVKFDRLPDSASIKTRQKHSRNFCPSIPLVTTLCANRVARTPATSNFST